MINIDVLFSVVGITTQATMTLPTVSFDIAAVALLLIGGAILFVYRAAELAIDLHGSIKGNEFSGDNTINLLFAAIILTIVMIPVIAMIKMV
jgi:hypothetical protein